MIDEPKFANFTPIHVDNLKVVHIARYTPQIRPLLVYHIETVP